MSEPLSGVIRLFDRLNAAAAWLARWSVLLMLAIGIWNVVGRYHPLRDQWIHVRQSRASRHPVLVCGAGVKGANPNPK